MEALKGQQSKPTPRKISSFASGKLRWNRLNGSGPVNERSFVRFKGTDHTHSHDWVFQGGIR